MTDGQKQLINKYLDEFAALSHEDQRVVALALHEEYCLRATGRSTRQVDDYIQELYNKGYCKVRDHSGAKFADEYLLNLLIKRIRSEHTRMNFKVLGMTVQNLSFISK